MMNDSLMKIEPIKRSNSMFLHPSPDIDIKVIKQIGDYSLGTELGSGAFGKVVLGKHILTNELVAIKILDKMILNNTPDDYQSVRQEINILKSVKHKHIVQLYDVLQTSRHIFIIMEYCEGKDLLDYILTKSKLSEEESLKYFQQLINALFYLHSQNIAHRDIKIDNMLLDRNRDLKLVDFGLSTKYPDDNLLDQPCGTVVYAAPEVLQGREYHGMLADVWSSGIVLYGMLSGYLPFGEQDDEINRKNIIMGNINYPNYFSNWAKDLLMHMLDLDPMTRYTLQEVRSHPWFNLIDYKLIPGIIIGYNVIPVDEKILNLCVTYNCDKEKVRESVVNNKYNSDSALYYLLIKKLQKKGFHSVSDFYSDEFINFVLDDNNLVEVQSKYRNDNLKKVQESEIKYNININANNNCSAPPDGKLRYQNEKHKNDENKENKDNNIITPKNSGLENINKKINFDETSKGVLSFIINTPSFEETNKELFKMKHSNSNNNNVYKLTNNDNESKKTNKNTSSDSKQRNYQVVNVNDFQITDDKNNENPENKIINLSKLDNNINSNNNIFIDENNKSDHENEYENEKDYKILNVLYNHTDNTEKSFKENENPKLNEKEQYNNNILKRNLDNLNIKETGHLNSNLLNHNINKNNIFDNSIEIIYDKLNETKNRNNADILGTPIISSKVKNINDDVMAEKLLYLDKKINNEFLIETPPNNKEKKDKNKDITDDNNCSKNKNTLSKQKVYIDKNKTISEKKRNEEKNKLDINKIKDIRKINLFQDEIKEEENYKKDLDKDEEKIIFSEISGKLLNDSLTRNSIKTISKKESNDLKIDNNQNTPNKPEKKEIIEILTLNTDSNINKSFPRFKDNNIIKDKLIKKDSKDNNNKTNENINQNNEPIKNSNAGLDLKNKNNNEDIISTHNKDIINNDNINTNSNNISINNNNDEKKDIDKKDININNDNSDINKKEIIINNDNINKNIGDVNTNINKEKEEVKNNNSNNQEIKEENIKKEEEKAPSPVATQKIKKRVKKNKLKKKDINNNIGNKIKNDFMKKKNPMINSILKNYKAIIDNNKSIDYKNKKSSSKSKEKAKMSANYSSKNRCSKNKEKEIISIKVIINKNLLSKEKNKKTNNKSKNKTEQQERKIKSIYKVGIPPSNLSKSKYTTINKKQTISIFKKHIIKNCFTNKKYIKEKIINGTHLKSSSIHIFGTVVKNDKYIKKNINNTANNSNSLFKINGIMKSKNKQMTSSRVSKNKKVVKSNFLIKSYNNKYMKLFKSTQFKNNNLLFTNKIDKTNLNKKFDEIAHKINKNVKINKNNKFEEKKVPLWKYIQSDQILGQSNSNNTKRISSSPHMNSNNIKKTTAIKNQKMTKNIRDKVITQNYYDHKTNDNIHFDNKNLRIKDHNFNINVNKLNNINNKSASLSKDKNINVFFINIKNYINQKNANNNKNNIKRANKNNIESSATNHKYRSPYEIRELSESLKNKYLNQKTRNAKIPWKIKKKALDEKIEISDLYKYYMNKNKNPFKKNNKKITKKINNIKPITNYLKINKRIENQPLIYLNTIKKNNNKLNNNYIPINDKNNININQYQNIVLTNKKNENIKSANKICNQSYTPQYIHKKSFFPTFNFINQRNIQPNNLFHSSKNYTENNNNSKFLLFKNYSYIFDLSCLFMKAENINECYRNLIEKLIKKNIYYVQKPNKVLRCFKNGFCCEIEIMTMDVNKNGKNTYCYKIMGKNGSHVNKMFKNLLLDQL